MIRVPHLVITTVLAVGISLCTLSFAGAYAMPDIFLNIDGIPGESTDAKHKDWIEVLSFDHGVTQKKESTCSNPTVSQDRSTFSDFTVVKSVDNASPKLSLACSNGDVIPQVTIEICKDVSDKPCYKKYTFTDVIISGIKTTGSGGSIPNESVSFNYCKMDYTYTVTNPKTGKSTEVKTSSGSCGDNSHKNGPKNVGSGVPDPIRDCILQHLNDPKYAHVGVGRCIQKL